MAAGQRALKSFPQWQPETKTVMFRFNLWGRGGWKWLVWEPAGGASPLNWSPDPLPIPCTFTLQAMGPQQVAAFLPCFSLASHGELCLLISGSFIFLKTTPIFTLPNLLSHMLQLPPLRQTHALCLTRAEFLNWLGFLSSLLPGLSPAYPTIIVLAFPDTGSPQTPLPCLGALPARVRGWYGLMSSPE